MHHVGEDVGRCLVALTLGLGSLKLLLQFLDHGLLLRELVVKHLLLSVLSRDVSLLASPLAASLEQVGTVTLLGCNRNMCYASTLRLALTF